MAIAANCPNCGGQVQFRVGSSVVTVCDFCSSAVARTDRGFEDLGKVADLVDSQSPLDLWLEGRYGDARFEIVGRAQVQHSMGGLWDEWYCAFQSGHWGWLAEAQGRFYMSFRTEAPHLPAFDSLQPGMPVGGVGSQGMVVAEIGEGTTLGARGEIPYPLTPGERYRFADLQGPGGTFGTIDYGDATPVLYLGKQVTLDELGISLQAPAREVAVTEVKAARLECPGCRGSLDLVAPDQTERVGCPFCGALSEVGSGQLRFLQLLDKARFPDPPLPLGKKGVFEGHEMTVCGYMVRSTSYEGVDYSWQEYLLYHPRVGFRWLLCNEGHWSYVESVNVADCSEGYKSASHRGESYRIFDKAIAQVDHVVGEFYWRVEVGERTEVADYMRPPFALSCERTDREINWSRSTYIGDKDLEKKFGVRLPQPSSRVVPLNQPYAQTGIYKIFGMLLLAALVLYGYLSTRNTGTEVFAENLSFPSSPDADPQVVFSEPFELRGDRNIEIEAHAPVSNAWAYFVFDLVNEETGRVVSTDLPVEYYHGTDSDGAWSEGDNTNETYLGAQPEGRYILRTSLERQDRLQPMTARVSIRQGVQHLVYFLVALGFLAAIPLLVFLHHRRFEQKRWSESRFSGPFWAQGSGDDE